MAGKKRRRNVPLYVWVSSEELQAIKDRMEQTGIRNMSAYVRKMALKHSFEDCGFIEAVEGQPCGHVHDGDCGFVEAAEEIPCDMDCNETGEDSQIIHGEGCAYAPEVEGAPCQHEHNGECGYVPADPGQPCGFVCRICPVQALIDALPAQEDITAENRAEVEAQLAAIDTARAELTDEEIDALDITRYAAAVSVLAALDGQAGADVPMLADNPAEQFPALTPGNTYWFDLSREWIPGTVNTGNYDGAVTVPDTTLHWVPFTYAGTINAYFRTSEGVSTDQNVDPCDHSLFIADYNVTHSVNWNDLNASDKNLIFGKTYTSGGVGYTLRAPSMGSYSTGSGDHERGTPQSNEWDMILDKGAGYIKNWSKIHSWGQDTRMPTHYRSVRGISLGPLLSLLLCLGRAHVHRFSPRP